VTRNAGGISLSTINVPTGATMTLSDNAIDNNTQGLFLSGTGLTVINNTVSNSGREASSLPVEQ
jgi:parallel beta-helix repeat protein